MSFLSCKNGPSGGTANMTVDMAHPAATTNVTPISYTNTSGKKQKVFGMAFTANEYDGTQGSSKGYIKFTTTGTVTYGYGVTGRMYSGTFDDLSGVATKGYTAQQHAAAKFYVEVELENNQYLELSRSGSTKMYDLWLVHP